MDKEEDVGKTPSVDSPSGGVKSAAGINNLENVPANNNSDDAGFPTTLRKAKKELFPGSNKRLSNTTNTPNKGGAKKKAKEAKHSFGVTGQKAQGRRDRTNKNNNTRIATTTTPSSPSESTEVGKKLRFTRNTRQLSTKSKATFKITPRQLVQSFRPDTFGGKRIASEEIYDEDDIAKHDQPIVEAAHRKFDHHKLTLSAVKEGCLTNDFTNLSRLHLEDMLTQHDDKNPIPLRILVTKPDPKAKDDNKDDYISGIMKKASNIYWHQQRHGELGVHVREIMTVRYNELYATLVPNKHHKLIKEGNLSKKEIQDLLDGDGGFELRFEGTTSMSKDSQSDVVTIKLKWKDMVEYPGDLMIFGPRSTSIRSYSSIFIDKTRLEYIHHIHRQFSLETLGDTEATLALNTAYETKKAITLREDAKILAERKEKGLIDAMNFLGGEQSAFLQRIDGTFKGALENSLVRFQEYNEPIVSKEKIVEFMEEAHVMFPVVWAALCSMRGVELNEERSKHLVESKLIQVFFQLLSLARQADDRRLAHWAFVQALASYGWGIGKKPQNIASYWGNTCSTGIRDGKMKDMAKNLLPRQIVVLSQCNECTLCYDNVQRGEERKQQRGGISNNFLKATQQVAIEVNPYNNTAYDDHYVDMTYNQHQPVPSPSGFPAFEDVDLSSIDEIANVFTNHDSIERKAVPDFSGERVRSFHELLGMSVTLTQTKRFFYVENVCPGSALFDDDKINTMCQLVRSSHAAPLLKGAKDFQSKTVDCWNPFAGQTSQTLMLGVSGLPEETAKQCGALLLDQLYRTGILVENETGTWKLAEGYEKRRLYLYGDRKTIENMAKFVRDIANRRMSYDDVSNQAEVFMDAMSVVMQLPGDWHAGLAMLKSIFTLFYDGFLKPFQEALKWKRINKDVGGCYFQACRLAGYVADELMRALMYEYASTFDKFSGDDASEKDYATFLCKFAIGFMKFLQDMKTSKDEVRRACALYLIMHTEFRTFVDSYRCGDAVAILLGYNSFVSYWQMLGQNKYVECVWAQNEQLFRDFPFSRFMEAMMNRCIRLHPEKRMVAQDEHLELRNACLAALPIVKCVESYIRQGHFIGVIERAKRFVAELYTLGGSTTVSKSIEPSMIPEMKLIFEMIMKLEVCSPDENRRYDSKLVYHTVDKLTTDIARAKDKVRFSCSGDHSYNRIYSSVHQMLSDGSTRGDNADENGGGDEGNADELDEDEIMASVRGDDDNEESETATEEVREENGKGRMYRKAHKDMLEDLDTQGWEKINAMNLKEVRAIAYQRAKRQRKVNQEIAAVVKDLHSGRALYSVGEELDNIPLERVGWKNFLRQLRKHSKKTDIVV